MHIVVTSVSAEECAESMRIAVCQIGDWLSAALSDADFGADPLQVTIVVVSVSDDPSENARWVKPHNRLGSLPKFSGAKAVRHLSIAVPVQPSLCLSQSSAALLETLSLLMREALCVRPARLPVGFAYDRFSTAASTALLAFQDVA